MIVLGLSLSPDVSYKSYYFKKYVNLVIGDYHVQSNATSVVLSSRLSVLPCLFQMVVCDCKNLEQ